eukprot:6246840-Pyramimonas_sp.AAC.1
MERAEIATATQFTSKTVAYRRSGQLRWQCSGRHKPVEKVKVEIAKGVMGPRLSNAFTMTAEIEQRIAAVERGWAQLRRFWTSGAPLRLWLNLFKCQAIDSALGGLEIWAGKYTPLQTSDLAGIEPRVIGQGGVSLLGAASHHGGR